MGFFEEDRPSDSPLIERVWRSQSDQSFGFRSRAEVHSEMVIVKHRGVTTVSIRGPETVGTPAVVAADAECLGIVFKLGTFVPSLLPAQVLDRRDADFPGVSPTQFLMNHLTWEIPTFENADTFVSRWVRHGLLVHDAEVAARLQDDSPRLSPRALQYRVVRATGLPLRVIRQIERARKATELLGRGASLLDTVFEAGYFDQPHLTRSLKRFVGLTPRQIAQARWAGSLLTLTV